MDMHSSLLGGPGTFPETSWSLLRGVKDPAAAGYKSGMDTLFRRYWGPVYRFIHRNWTRDVEEAKDLVQAFFLAFFEKGFAAQVDADKGRFRNFVCAALRHFLLNHKRAQRARKRRPEGGLVSLEALTEANPGLDVADPRSSDPFARFNRDWKRALLDVSLERLKRLGEERGKQALVGMFLACDLEPGQGTRPTYRELAERHGMTANQVRNGLYWVRKEFVAILRREIQEQTASEEDFRAEVAALFG